MTNGNDALVVVTSAAGMSGQFAVKALTRRGVNVRGLVRRPEQAVAIERLGATTAIGDVRDPDFVASALVGATAVYHICPRLVDFEVELGRSMIAAASVAKVRRFVFQSVAHSYIQEMPHHWDKLQVQILLERAEIPFAVIQPTNYMQNVTWAWNQILASGVYDLPYSADAPLTWVDAEDVAEAAATVLTDPAFEGGTYELCGTDRALSRHEICELLTDRLGRKIQAGVRPWSEWRNIPRYRNWSVEQLRRLEAMFTYYDRHGFRAGNRKVAGMVLGREPAHYSDFLDRLVAKNQAGSQTVLPS